MANALERLLGMAPTKPNKSEDVLADEEAPQVAEQTDDQTPEHLQLMNVLARMERMLSRDINHFADIQEEFGVYQTDSTKADKYVCTVTQPVASPLLVHTVVMTFDTAITSWTLTLGRKVWQFNSSGSNGMIALVDLNIPLHVGATRSLAPVSGTPVVNSTLYICGELVRMN